MPEHKIFQKIISGGQTGADQGALDAALELNYPCGGWCPCGRKSEAGSIPERYPLQEHQSQDTADRTRANVLDSDGTLIFFYREPIGGTLYTLELARHHHKPFYLVDLEQAVPNRELDRIWNWGRKNRVYVLNIAGPRESKNPGVSGEVKKILLNLLLRG